MTETTNIKTMKVKILMVAIVLAALVAAMAATAKPAEAATCAAYAETPYYHTDIMGRQWIMFASSVKCSGGSVDNISIQSKGYQYYGGRWNLVSDSGRKYLGKRGSYFRVKTQVLCTAPYTGYSFRTNNITPQIKVNGVWKTLLSKETKALRTC